MVGTSGGRRHLAGWCWCGGLEARNEKTTNWTSVCKKHTCFLSWSVFVSVFRCFSIWGSWSSAWRKKSQKKCARGTGDALLRPACPSSAPLRPGPGPPARLPLRALLAANCQLYLGQFDLLLGPQKLLFCCWRRKWEMLSTFQHAVGTDVPSKTLQYPPDDCMGPRVGKGSRQARYLQGHRVWPL